MYKDGKWNDNSCYDKRGYVCRRRQHPSGGGGGTSTTVPNIHPHAGAIAGGVIGALLAVVIIVSALYYIFRVKGVKLSSISFPSRKANHVDVPAFNNPNFGGESDT
ncbi:uncharacterized protein Hap1MRO34_021706 [Clarias gariepinus]